MSDSSAVGAAEVTTDRAGNLAKVIEDQLPAAVHDTRRYADNRVEADHGRLKASLRPMRGLKRTRTASVIIAGHAFMQNLRRGHDELALLAAPRLTVATGFDELARAVWPDSRPPMLDAVPRSANATAAWLTARDAHGQLSALG